MSGLVGYISTSTGAAISLDVEGGFAYIGDLGGRNLQIIDVSDPMNPVLRGTYDSAGGQEICDIDVVGGYAYLSNDLNGLVKVDISDPDNPFFVSSRNDGTYSNSFDYDGGEYGFATYSYTSGSEFKVYDINNFPAAAPADYDALGDRHASAVDVVGDRAYITTAAYGGFAHFEIIDVSDPESPSAVGNLALPAHVYGNYEGELQVVGDYAFLAQTAYAPAQADGGLLVLDLTNEASPSVVAFEEIPDAADRIAIPGGTCGPGLEIVEDMAFLTSKTGLYVFDVSDPTNPVTLIDPNIDTDYQFPTTFMPSEGGWVDTDGEYIYVTTGFQAATPGGLAIYEMPAFKVECDLFIDKNAEGDVGDVVVQNDSGTVTVAVVGDSVWALDSGNMHLGDIDTVTGELVGFPLNKSGNPKVGKFDYKEQAIEDELIFTLSAEDLCAADLDGDGTIALAVQADLYAENPLGTLYENSWAACDTAYETFPGDSSASFLVIELAELGL